MLRFIYASAVAAIVFLGLTACGQKASGGPDPNAPAQVGVRTIRAEPVTLALNRVDLHEALGGGSPPGPMEQS